MVGGAHWRSASLGGLSAVQAADEMRTRRERLDAWLIGAWLNIMLK